MEEKDLVNKVVPYIEYFIIVSKARVIHLYKKMHLSSQNQEIFSKWDGAK